jgi:hypothetical protein
VSHFKRQTIKPTSGSWQSTRKPRTNIKIGSFKGKGRRGEARGREEQKRKDGDLFSCLGV